MLNRPLTAEHRHDATERDNMMARLLQNAGMPPGFRLPDPAGDMPRRADMIERLRRGDICDLVVDTETSDLSKYFAHPSALGAVLADPFTRTVLHMHERQVRFPADIATFDVVAGLVTERSPETFDQGMRPDLAMAEFYDLIRHAPRFIADFYAAWPDRVHAHNRMGGDTLPLPPEGDDAVVHYRYVTNRRTQAEREARIRTPRQTRAARDVVFIPMRGEQEQVVYEAGISRDGRFVYWREDDGAWHRTEAKKTVLMHNQRADNNWIWEWCHRYLLPDQFITHTKKYRAFLLDTIPLAREVALLGPQGRNGLKLGVRMDAALGPVSSASLDTILKANRRIANARLALNHGVRIAGGAQADPRMGHVSPAYDGLKTLGLYWYCQDIAPDLVRYKKHISDHDVIGDEILSPLPDGSPAPFTFIRARYPHLDAHAGFAVNIDKSYGDFKKAVVLTLDLLREDPDDPAALRLPDGRNVFDLDAGAWADILRKSHTDRHSPLEIVPLNKSAMIQTLESGLKSGALAGVSPETLHIRAQMLARDTDLGMRIMEAYADTRTRQAQESRVHDPRPEEYVFAATGDPLRMQIPRPVREEKDEMERVIFERAKSKLDFYAKRNHYLRILMRPYPEIEDADNEDPESFREYERHFKKTLRKYERHMRGNAMAARPSGEIPRINVPKYKRARFKSNKQVRKFLWALRRKALKKGWLVDISSGHYRVVDEDSGREISMTRLSQMDIRQFRDAMDPVKGSWDIQFERLNHQQHFLAHLFLLADRKKDLFDIDDGWKLWYKAQKAFGHNGSPLVDADAQRLATSERNLSVIRRIRGGAHDTKSDLKFFALDPDGAASIRARVIDALPGREQILASFERISLKNRKKSRWDDETLEYAGYDGVSRRRLENIAYPIAREVFDAASKFVMPDAAPQNPIASELAGEAVFPVPLEGAIAEAWKDQKLPPWKPGVLSVRVNAVFRTARTGRTYLVPKAAFTLTTLERHTPHYQMVRRIFEDSAIAVDPAQTPILMVSGEGFIPVSGVRVVEPHFALPVPGQHRFTALLAPEIAGYRDGEGGFSQKLGALAIPDYGYESARGYRLDKGATIRLRETDAEGRETGWEIPVCLKDVAYLTLAQFEENYARRKITPDIAHRYGFAGPEAMYTEICQWFTAFDKPKDAPENRIMLIRFRRAKRWEGMEYFQPSAVPRAAVMETYGASLSRLGMT